MSCEPSASEKHNQVPMKLGYWKIRGLAQAIRLLLKYTGTEFENVLYEHGPAPEYSKESWTSVKFTLGLDFPNLPYLIDGDIKITESTSIMHYVARKNNLCGRTEPERVAAETVEGVLRDVWLQFAHMCYSPNYAEMRPAFVKNIATKLKQLSDFLGEKEWFAGEEMTYVDFSAYEEFSALHLFESSLFDNCPNLTAYCDRFEALPAIKEYMQSPDFIARPVHSPSAQWK